MEIWQRLDTLGKKFNDFFESIPKADRKYLDKCSSREYDAYINKYYLGGNCDPT